jgi:hypothetical protein
VTDAEFIIASEDTADASDVILMYGNTEWETNYATSTVDFLKQQAALAEISVLHEKTLAAVAATSQAPVHTPSEQILPATSEDAADASDVLHEKTLAAVAATSQAPVHTPSEQILPATSEDAADASDVILKNVNTEWETSKQILPAPSEDAAGDSTTKQQELRWNYDDGAAVKLKQKLKSETRKVVYKISNNFIMILWIFIFLSSVADPGSGALSAPGLGMGKKSGSVSSMNYLDHIS